MFKGSSLHPVVSEPKPCVYPLVGRQAIVNVREIENEGKRKGKRTWNSALVVYEAAKHVPMHNNHTHTLNGLWQVV
jgi:hypothetical protein